MISWDKNGIILVLWRILPGTAFFRLKGGGGLPFFAKAKKSIVFFFKNTDRILLLLCVLTSVYGFILVYSAAGGSFRG